MDKSTQLDGKTIVIGGGNVAIDVARTATRVGSASVEMYCLEDRNEMPALDEEINEAKEEGIAINNAWGPKRLLVENGHVVGVEFRKCLSVFEENKRFSPKFDENETIIVEANNVLISVGQGIDWGNIIDGSRIELNANNTIKADPITNQTAEPDVFTGGDAFTGPKFAIDAIAMGKEGSISIHRYVNHGQSLTIGRLNRDYRSFDKGNLILDGYDRLPRQRVEQCDTKLNDSFKDLRGILSEGQIKKETERCLGCGAAVVDEFMCIGCGACTTKCKFDAIKLIRKYDIVNPEFDKMKPAIIKYALKRQVKIAVNKPLKLMHAFLSGEKNN